MLLLETFLVRSDAVSLDYIASACQHQLVNLFHNNTDQRVKDKASKVENRQSLLLFFPLSVFLQCFTVEPFTVL